METRIGAASSMSQDAREARLPRVEEPLVARIEDIRSLDIILTTRCNLACSYCFQNVKNDRRMRWDTLHAALDMALGTRRSEVELMFSGGEPLLEFPLIQKSVSYVRSARSIYSPVRYVLTTNGTILDESKCDFLSRHQFKVQLSFDGVAGAQHFRGKDTYSILDGVLTRLAASHSVWYGHSLSINITLSARTIPYLAESFDYFLEKRVRRVGITPLFTHDAEWKDEHVDALDRQFDNIFRSSKRHFYRTGDVPLTIFRRTIPDAQQPSHQVSMCNALTGNALAVDVNGQLYGCSAFTDSYQKPFRGPLSDRLAALRLGDLHDVELPERLADYPRAVTATGIFSNKEEKYSSYAKCGTCSHIHTCLVCPASIAHIPGNSDTRRVSDFQCAFNLVSNRYRTDFTALYDD